MSNSVVITAGGRGTRMSSIEKKQFMLLDGRPIIFRTIDNFVEHNLVDEIIIVLPEAEIEFYNQRFRQEYTVKPVKCTIGAGTRQESVYNGLKAIDRADGLVLIHDGVRPFISADDIDRLIHTASVSGGVIPATRIKNTIKKIEGDLIADTLDRSKLIQVHTPQVFKKELIIKLHNRAKNEGLNDFTDDAGILEYYGYDVKYVICSEKNIKITNPIDLLIAEYILKEGQNYE